MPRCSNEDLVRLIQDFLDAELLLEQRRIETGSARLQEERFNETRQKLQKYLAGSLCPSHSSLANPARAYLASVNDLEIARGAGDDLDLPARKLEAAQLELQDAIYQSTHDAASDSIWGPRKILVAMDEDQRSDWALTTAVQMAESLPARLKLITVAPLVIPQLPEQLHDSADLEGIARRRAAEFLARKRASVPDEIDCDTLVRLGEPTSEIVSAARRWGADFIILATHARGRLARFVLGSTAASVVRLAPCPVITVGHCPDERNRPSLLKQTAMV